MIEKIKKFSDENDIVKILTAMFSQGILSMANFFIGFTIAKFATKEEYGLYVFLFSFIGIIAGYHNAVISAPLMVNVNNWEFGDRNVYVRSLCRGRWFLLLATMGALFGGFKLYGLYARPERDITVEMLVMIVAAMMFVSKEFMRTLQFTRLNTINVLVMDILMVVIVAAGLSSLILLDTTTCITGMLVLGAGYTGSYLFGRIKFPYTGGGQLEIKKALLENWKHARWLIFGVTASLLQNRSYIYVVSAILGLATLADVSASRLFLMPISLMNLSSAKIIVAKGSIMVSRGDNSRFRRFLFGFLFALLAVWLIYVTTITMLADSLIGFLGEKYVGIKGLISVWAAYFFVYTMRFILGTGVVVFKQFKKQAQYDVYGSVLTIVSSVFMVMWIGKSGAIFSLIAGELLVMVLYLRLLNSERVDTGVVAAS